MASKSALAILANGTEEMEIVITVNVLRRAGVSSIFIHHVIYLNDIQIKKKSKYNHNIDRINITQHSVAIDY